MSGRGGRGRGRGGGKGGRGRGNGGRGRGRGNAGRGRGKTGRKAGAPSPPAPSFPRASKASSSAGPIKKNGEKGAETHTVSEKERIKFTKILLDLREGDETKLEFPPNLTNTERKFLHELAGQLGLVSKSTGKGENRRIAVSKRAETIKPTTAFFEASNNNDGSNDKNASKDLPSIPTLTIGQKGVQALRQHLAKFPPSHAEDLESHETGSSLAEAVALSRKAKQNLDENEIDATTNEAGRNQDAIIAATLQQLGLGQAPKAKAKKVKPKYVNLDQRRARHASFQKAKRESSHYSRMMQQRRKLPAFARQDEIVATVANNPVTILQGETGCGKSTQCPQFLLDANPDANIVVTQPRRISAISIADRVAQEQCLTQRTNEDDDIAAGGVGSLVGYQVRLEAAATKDTQLLFVTPGILLRKLQSSPTLNEFTHIIIDEIHERDRYTEFLLITLRDLLPIRPDLRLVLMSATLQTDLLYDYFQSYDHPFFQSSPPAILEIEGRTFPVQEFFLEQVLELTGYIDPAVAAAATGASIDANDPTRSDVVMSMEELDAELAKLMGTSDGNGSTAPQTKSKKASTATRAATIQCPMCGQFFPDHMALGVHVAICQGANTPALMTEELLGMTPKPSNALALPPAQMLLTPDQLLTSSDTLEGFDEYDVDEAAQIGGYEFQQTMLSEEQQESLEENDSNKWDGTGTFLQNELNNDASIERDITITPEQDALLNHYQTMHNDDQVDTDLLLDVLHYIRKSSFDDSAILIFLPGWQEISEVNMLLESTPPFHDRSKFLILPLHSGIPSADQRKVLRRPPTGTRKIVLSTNIAETSLTIDDVAFVVDSGRAKEKDYDPHLKTSTLQPTWISQASSKQRKGRAGRTKAGVCFHLFSSRRHESMRPFVESELLRTPLEEMCLFTKKLGLAPGGPEDENGVPAFLAKAISPPHEKSIANALDLLVDLGAIYPETNDLTDLGQCLSILSLEPRVGKMVIWSYLLGCARATSQMAIAMSYKSPFVLPPNNMRRDAEKAQVELSRSSESDQVTVFNAMLKQDQLRKKSEGAWRDFCRRHFLSTATMQMISELRRNITRELSSLEFPDPMNVGGYHNRNYNKEALWQAALSAGLYPNIATRRQGEVNFSTMTNRKCKIHVSSVNSVKGQPLNGKSQIPMGETEFVCFGEMVKGARIFTISQTTHLTSPLPLLLLSGTLLRVCPDPRDNRCAILGLDEWIIFKCEKDVAAGLVILRKRLNAAFLKALKHPSSLGTQAMEIIDRDAIEALGVILQSGLKSATTR